MPKDPDAPVRRIVSFWAARYWEDGARRGQVLNSEARVDIMRFTVYVVETVESIDLGELAGEDCWEEKWETRSKIDGFSNSVDRETGRPRWVEREERRVSARRESIPRS